MADNVSFYKGLNLGTDPTGKGGTDFSDAYSEGDGSDPIWNGETFDGTNGEGKFIVVYAHEDATSDFYSQNAMDVKFEEVTAGARDPDGDATNEVHGYTSAPVETAVTGETFSGDGTTTTFTLANAFVKPGSETVTVGGVAQTRNTDYYITYIDGVIEFATAPATGTNNISVDYTHGDDGLGNVNLPSAATIKTNLDFGYQTTWRLPHGDDANRATGSTKDGIPLVLYLEVDPGTTDPAGDPLQITGIDVKETHQELSGKL